MTDYKSQHGTWLNGRRITANQAAQVTPGDKLEFGTPGSLQLTFKVKMCHDSIFDQLAASSGGVADSLQSMEDAISAGPVPQPV